MKKYDELMMEALTALKENGYLFVDCVNELDSWNGFADGFRAYHMEELDELCYGMKVSEFIEKLTEDFHKNDDFFYFSIYGLESTDDIEELYRDNVDEGELLDELIANYSNLDIEWIDRDFDALIESIVDYSEEEITE